MAEVLVPDAVPIDYVADLALRTSREAPPAAGELRCDACDCAIEGEPAGRGLFMWQRGEEFRVEEPPLCIDCATAISVTALQLWSMEEDEG